MFISHILDFLRNRTNTFYLCSVRVCFHCAADISLGVALTLVLIHVLLKKWCGVVCFFSFSHLQM